jgi:2-methylisocitrate lyase-like PEP mutase family enzyme
MHSEAELTRSQAEKAEEFLELHRAQRPLLLANPWDAGSAKLFAALGFRALASTSSGFAASLGRLDYGVSREEALAHAAVLAGSVDVPVSADLEDCFAEDADGVAETVRLALATGLAGCSIEDWNPRAGALYEPQQAAERVTAAAQAAHAGPVRLVLTARAENYLRGVPDLDDTIARLQAYERAGADVLYAPGLDRAEDLRVLVSSVQAPVNVLVRGATPSVAELAELGVARVSVGGHFAFAALAAAREAAQELLEGRGYAFAERSAAGARAAREAFGS